MTVKFSEDLNDILELSASEALRTGYRFISVDHIVLACLRHADNSACLLLEAAGIDCDELKDYIDSRIFRSEALPYDVLDNIAPRRESVELMCVAGYETLKNGSVVVRPIHVILATSRVPGSETSEFLYEHGLDYDILMHIWRGSDIVMPEDEVRPDETKKILRALTDSIARTFNPEDNSRIFPS